MKITKRDIIVFITSVILTLICVSPVLKYKPYIDTFTMIQKNYDGEIDKDYASEVMNKAFAQTTGDPHTMYLTEDELESFSYSLGASRELIGVRFYFWENTPIVYSVQKGSPAYDAGLASLDVIKTINGKDASELGSDKVLDEITNSDVIDFTYYRPSEDASFEVSISKEEIKEETVYSKMISVDEKKYGFIKLTSFSQGSDVEFEKVLTEFENEQIDELVIDLRDNPGGDLKVASNIANLIIPNDKPFYSLKRGTKTVEQYYSTLEEAKPYEITVLVNQNSASASEILTAGLKEINGSDVIGTTTYGKGSAQQLFEAGNGAFKITTKHWYTPDEELIDGVGIDPTIEDTSNTYIRNIPIYNKLKVGDNSVLVKQLNNELYVLGYDVQKDSTVFTDKTKQALLDFQAKNNLEATGELNVDTQKVLYQQASVAYYSYGIDGALTKAIDN